MRRAAAARGRVRAHGRRLTHAITERWPEAPPYGGASDEVIPHLTVAQGDDLDHVEAAVARGLPIRTRLEEARLYAFDGERWRPRERLPFEG